MTRGNPARAHPAAHVAPLVDGEVRPGRYKVRLVKGAAWSAVWIWFGRPLSKKGRRMFGPWGYYALCNGEPCPLWTVWPKCVAFPISRAEYGFIRKLNRWAARRDPTSPEAASRSPVDWLRSPTPY